MEPAPIALFAYNRPEHLRRCVEALLANAEAGRSDLTIFSDGPRGEHDAASVEAVRRYAASIAGFRSLTVEERRTNLGGPVGIPEGISQVCSRHGRAIVLEDDEVVAPFYLSFMNRALELYEADEDVVCVSGYTFPHRGTAPGTFFFRGALSEGWATWARGWDLFEPDAELLLAELGERGLVGALDRYDRTYSRMLEPRPDKPVPAWDVRWYASTFLRGGLTLVPGESLVQNIGFDGTGTNVGVGSSLDVPLATKPPVLERIPLEEDPLMAKEFKRFLRDQAGGKFRLLRRIRGA